MDKPWSVHPGSKSFSSQERLIKHHDRVHFPSAHLYALQKIVPLRTLLKSHMFTHSEGKNFKCSVCNKPFSFPTSLRRHMESHSREEPVKCSICAKTYTCRSNLDRHMREHKDGTSLLCEVCGKSFKRADHLQRHELTHKDVEVICSVCGKMCMTKGGLVCHMENSQTNQGQFLRKSVRQKEAQKGKKALTLKPYSSRPVLFKMCMQYQRNCVLSCSHVHQYRRKQNVMMHSLMTMSEQI